MSDTLPDSADDQVIAWLNHREHGNSAQRVRTFQVEYAHALVVVNLFDAGPDAHNRYSAEAYPAWLAIDQRDAGNPHYTLGNSWDTIEKALGAVHWEQLVN